MTMKDKAKLLFEDAATRNVFEAVAKPRTILIRDLKNTFSGENLEHSINVLKEADLIKEKPAVINDFSTLYLTADGMDAVQALKRYNLKTDLF